MDATKKDFWIKAWARAMREVPVGPRFRRASERYCIATGTPLPSWLTMDRTQYLRSIEARP